MSFEEEFPSLKDCFSPAIVELIKDDVVMCCLDKQRVREVFEEILENATDLEWEYRVKDGIKRLGLIEQQG